MASHSHVLVYHGPLLINLLGVEPSTFTMVYILPTFSLRTPKSGNETLKFLLSQLAKPIGFVWNFMAQKNAMPNC